MCAPSATRSTPASRRLWTPVDAWRASRSVTAPTRQPRSSLRAPSADVAEAFAAVQPLLDEYADIEQQLADPSVHAEAGRARTLGRRFAELGRVVAAHHVWEAAVADLEAAQSMAEADP